MTEDETNHVAVDRQRPGTIEIEFVNPEMKSVIAPSCSVCPSESDMRVRSSYRKSSGIEDRYFQILPTEQKEILVIVGRTANESGLPTERKLDAKAFADHMLDFFVNYKW